MSGVVPGTYGNENQIPTFTVDARGRLVWAANVDINSTLNVKVNREIRSLSIRSKPLTFLNSDSISFSQNDDGISASINLAAISQDNLRSQGAIVKNQYGIVEDNLVLNGTVHFTKSFAVDGNFTTSAVVTDKISTQSKELSINDIVFFTSPITRSYQDVRLFVQSAGEVLTETIRTARGNTENPTPVQKGDELHRTSFKAKSSSDFSAAVVTIATLFDQEPNFSGAYSIAPLMNQSPIRIDNDNLLALSVTPDGIGVGIQRPKSLLDINGVMRLIPQSSAPASPFEGMIAVADGTNWNPVNSSSGSYPVYFNGSSWIKMIG
jgi:hypothetical protein